ncbi:hypothetical protein [Comamonas squillarum]|uniref:Uncharacterized protein n=1 Tax=Comamonas squillarum TaxID=2977320 RepID=A0ABY5ZYD8_9BURK|nr:hypothetical protein [Comamonas sp. PR12]UXC19017.1 hypothetical protein N4T19_02510 [Comamonas sp. PR12]
MVGHLKGWWFKYDFRAEDAMVLGGYLIKAIKIDNFLNASIRTLFAKVSNQDFPRVGACTMVRNRCTLAVRMGPDVMGFDLNSLLPRSNRSFLVR